MFLQVRLPEENRAYHRVLIWNSKGEDVTLEFLRHVFGCICSPAVAMFAARFLAEPFKELYPRAVEVITDSTIMDDWMDSFSTEEEAKAVRDQLVKIYGSGGMEIRKWTSSEEAVLEGIPEGDRAKAIEVTDKLQSPRAKISQYKTLGVVYTVEGDEFQVGALEVMGEEDWTKRKVLQHYMKVFDPLGLVLPFIVTARAIFQDLWHRYADWDEPIEERHLLAWKKWRMQATGLSKVSFDRCLQVPHEEHNRTEMKLHVFL